MRQRNRFLLMAFIAMFAVSTPADAQFGLGKADQPRQVRRVS